MTISKTLYTAHADAWGGRDGHAKTDDGKLDVRLAAPEEMGGTGDGTNPEQLFAAGYSACFLGAMKFVAAQRKTTLPESTRVGADVGIGPLAGDTVGFGITVALQVTVPGWTQADASELANAAHEVCPYSNATRGNADVALHIHV